MNILRTIAAGILIGFALFLMPVFLVKLVAIIFLFKMAFNLLGFSRRARFMNKFKNMTEEEKKEFMSKFQYRHCGHRYYHHTNA